jgi:two-component system sensor histidine kinase/response regulator
MSPHRTAEAEARITAATRSALAGQLLRAGAVTEVSHMIVITAAVVLVWGRLPDLMIIGWAVAVVATTATRGLARREALLRNYSTDRALRVTRLSVAGLGLAWGVGAAFAMTELPLLQVALLLLMLTGLVAGATMTLTPDRPSFFLFTAGILGPVPIGLLLNGSDREHYFAVFLVLMYAAFMSAQINRAHRGLVEYWRVQVLLRESEAAAVRERAYLDALFNSAPVGIVTLDLTGKIRRVNAAFEKLFGHTAAEAIGQPLQTVIVPEEDRETSERLRHEVTQGGRVSADVQRRRKDGSLVDTRLSASRVEAGDDTGVVILYEDVTTQVAARRAIEDARDVAERAAQARATFLANMSHEIRTPMNAILGFTELLLESELSPEQRHSLGLVQSSAETLLTLIDDILDFSKIEGDHLQLESILFDLPHLVESTAGLLGVRAREKRLEVLAHLEPGSPSSIRGDPTRLRQVLTNLIGNAIKFTHQGEVVVSVAPVSRQGDQAVVRFAVRDTGIGIAADKLDAIFAEFSQADASMTRRYGGTGLGLAIARRLVRLMGGELTVTSEEGKGTEFSFTMQFEVDTSAPTAPVHPSAAHLAGRRALIVDDSETNRRIVREMLGSAGMRITEVARGAAALDVLRRSRDEGKPFDIVILDQQMPDMDGFMVAAAARAEPAIADTRMLMLTSAGQRGDGQRCRELGIQGYLSKPASRSDLLEAAAAVLSAVKPATAAADIVTRHSIAEHRQRLRILVAEDNPVNQEVAATILRRRGHDVDLVGDGRAAVNAVAAERYDVVLMDIQMPLMDGLEATEAIRATERGRELPIIALTAHAQRGERERCLSRGMSGYLTKPFKAHELFAIIEGWADDLAPTASADAAPAEHARALDIDGFRRSMRDAGAEDAVPAILQTFESTAPARLTDLEAAVGANNAEQIQRAAHAYKSAAATVVARELARMLGDLEASARAGAVNGAGPSLEAIRAMHHAVLRELAEAKEALPR